MTGPMRSNTIYVPGDVLWFYRRVVKALNAGEATDRYSVDGLCTDILRQWVKERYPDLVKLRERRDGIDEEADRIVAKKLNQQTQ